MSTTILNPETFGRLIANITDRIAGRPLDQLLEDDLNRWLPPDRPEYQTLFESCQAGIAAGWMCTREAAGIRYGRVLKPGPATHGFSVDVVDMEPMAGPHHSHPNGEIDLIMPLSSGSQFDGRPAGWLVYGPGSAHSPTVTGDRALILYLLPGGAIEFTRG